MENRHLPASPITNINNVYAALTCYNNPRSVCDQQPTFTGFQEAPLLDTLKAHQNTRDVAGRKVSSLHQPEEDLNKELGTMVSNPSALGEGTCIRQTMIELQSAHKDLRVTQRSFSMSPLNSNFNDHYNIAQETLPSRSISQNYRPADTPQACNSSLPVVNYGPIPHHQSSMSYSPEQEQRMQLLQQQYELLSRIVQQNQILIDLLQQIHGLNASQQPTGRLHGARNLGAMSHSFQDGGISSNSTQADSRSAHSAEVAQIYANGAWQTTTASGFPFAQSNTECASSIKTSMKSKLRADELSATFKRIDNMYAALQRSEAEKATRQAKRSRKSRPRLHLEPSNNEEHKTIRSDPNGDRQQPHRAASLSQSKLNDGSRRKHFALNELHPQLVKLFKTH